MDSSTEAAEKAQHDPQEPWSFTGVILPVLLQSITPSEVIKLATVGGVCSELDDTSANEFEDEDSYDLIFPNRLLISPWVLSVN